MMNYKHLLIATALISITAIAQPKQMPRLSDVFENEYIACQISSESCKTAILKKNPIEEKLQHAYNDCRNGVGQWNRKHSHGDCAEFISVAMDIISAQNIKP